MIRVRSRISNVALKIHELLKSDDAPKMSDRFHDNSTDQRTPFERDRDRVLYTDYFQRLSGVTQVARTGESYLYHNRQSHSLKVAQIGQRLTEYLLEVTDEDILTDNHAPIPAVVETAALAHDLGHPPFGHTVEKELDRCVRSEGVDEGFEANAQSFRIVTELATHRERYDGLDLTRASLNAILKYPWSRGQNENKPKKYGYYQSEEDEFRFARELSEGIHQSIDAQIMDWSDDVAYAVHDLEDFYKAGLLPLDQIIVESEERDAFIEHIEDNTQLSEGRFDTVAFLKGFSGAAGEELRKPFTGTSTQKAAINKLQSHLIDRYLGYPSIDLHGVRLIESDDERGLVLDVEPVLEKEVEFLKELTRYYIINDSSLMAQQHGQRKVINTLFNHLMDQALPEAKYPGIIPSPYRDAIQELDSLSTHRERVRIVTDLITRLTEQQAVLLYERLEGTSPGSLQDRIIQF